MKTSNIDKKVERVYAALKEHYGKVPLFATVSYEGTPKNECDIVIESPTGNLDEYKFYQEVSQLVTKYLKGEAVSISTIVLLNSRHEFISGLKEVLKNNALNNWDLRIIRNEIIHGHSIRKALLY